MDLQQRLKELEQEIFVEKPGSGRMDAIANPLNSRNLRGYLNNAKQHRPTFIERLRSGTPQAPVIVLDIMCGAGAAVLDLLKLKGVVAYGIDIQSYAGWNAAPTNFIQADANSIPFVKSGRVDIIFSSWGIVEPTPAFHESLRLLKTGGLALYHPFGFIDAQLCSTRYADLAEFVALNYGCVAVRK